MKTHPWKYPSPLLESEDTREMALPRKRIEEWSVNGWWCGGEGGEDSCDPLIDLQLSALRNGHRSEDPPTGRNQDQGAQRAGSPIDPAL